ncbi:MAG: ABC transporter transmembrane domain-containing protein, partial [Gammaproteobacteria bacterium]|nr:ABC transporter transmembrane domain-containing protein [Gammaproteobacteria bacterium]
MNVIKRLILFSKKHYKLFFIAVVASTLASLLDVSFLYLIKQCTDRHHISSEFTPAVIISGILLLVVCRSLFNYVAEVWIFKFGRNVIMDIRNLLYDKLLSVKISDVEKKSTGDLTTKLLYQSDQLGNGLLNFLKSVLQEGFVVIGCIIALLFMNFMMTLMVLL